MAWICPCGTSNADNGQSCRRCGYRFSHPHAPTDPQQHKTSLPRKRTIFSPTVLGPCFILALAYWWLSGPPNDSTMRVWKMLPTPPIQVTVGSSGISWSSRPTPVPEETAGTPTAPVSRHLTELRGRLARRREYDLWLLANLRQTITAKDSTMKLVDYCMTLVYGAEQSLDSAPHAEYALQADGTVRAVVASTTPEQRFWDGQRMQYEVENGNPEVNACAGSFFAFRTWHNQPLPTEDELAESAAKTRADLNRIDTMLDPRLVENLPKPASEPPPAPPDSTQSSPGEK